MCTHNASGHGIGCQAVRTPYVANIQAYARRYKFHHLTYLQYIQVQAIQENSFIGFMLWLKMAVVVWSDSMISLAT